MFKKQPPKKSILFWSCRDMTANPKELITSLRAEGLGWLASQIPKPVEPPTALERARQKRTVKGFMFRSLGRTDDGQSHVAFVEERINAAATAASDAYNVDAIYTASTRAGGDLDFSPVPDMFQESATKLLGSYRREIGYLTQPQLGRLFTETILDRWSGVRIKSGTAVFLVPSKCRDEVDALNAAIENVAGLRCRFIMQDVGADEGEQFADEVRESILDEIESLSSKAKQMVSDAKGGKEFQFSTLEKRIREATEHLEKSRLYADILEDRQDEIDAAISNYKNTIMQVTIAMAEA